MDSRDLGSCAIKIAPWPRLEESLPEGPNFGLGR